MQLLEVRVRPNPSKEQLPDFWSYDPRSSLAPVDTLPLVHANRAKKTLCERREYRCPLQEVRGGCSLREHEAGRGYGSVSERRALQALASRRFETIAHLRTSRKPLKPRAAPKILKCVDGC